MFTSKHQLFSVTQKAAQIQTLQVFVSHLWGEPISYSGVAWSSRAHEAVWIAGEGVASRGEAVGRASFSLTSTGGGLVAGGGGQRLGTVHCAGWLRHCSKDKTDVIVPQPDRLNQWRATSARLKPAALLTLLRCTCGAQRILKKQKRQTPASACLLRGYKAADTGVSCCTGGFWGTRGTSRSITLAPFCPGDIFLNISFENL